MANIIDLFSGGGVKPEKLVGEKGFYNKESEIAENSKLQDKFISNVDYSKPDNFARFGSAEEYYRNAINYIRTEYPYDGSATEKLQWINALTELEFYIFRSEYPRAIGSVVLSSSQAVQAFASVKNNSLDAKETVYNGDKNGYDIYLSPTSGFTFETWLKTASASLSTVLDITAYDTSYAVQQILQITLANNKFTVGGTQLDTTIDSLNWHHYAFRIFTNTVDLFVDGQKVETKSFNTALSFKLVVTNKGFGKITSSRNELPEPPPNTNVLPLVTHGGSNTLYLDETRFWVNARTNEKIGRFWFTHVNGNDDIQNLVSGDDFSSLLYYYKYNEGWTGDYQVIVADYSGRKNNGIVTNPTSSVYRSTISAINASGLVAQDMEETDIIFGDTVDFSTVLSQYYTNKTEQGAEYDNLNIHALYKKFPNWVLETEDTEEIKHFKRTIHIVSVYFDDLYNKIGEISEYKHQKFETDADKIYPFYDKIVTSTGFDVSDLFSNVDSIQKISSRDDNNLFDEDIAKVKNTILQNIYNNLSYILKSKGTEKSIKGFLRSYGLGENLVKVNLYADKSLFNIVDEKSIERVIKKKTISLVENQYVTTTLSSTSKGTVEVQAFLPAYLVGTICLFTSNNIKVFLAGNGSQLRFEVVNGSNPAVTSSWFTISDNQMPWNLSLRFDNSLSKLNFDAIKCNNPDSYDVHSLTFTNNTPLTTLTIGAFNSGVTSISLTDVTVWNNFIDVDDTNLTTLKVHAKDITNYGNLVLNIDYTPQTFLQTGLLRWDLEDVDSLSGTNFTVKDLFGAYNGTGYNFTAGDLSFIRKEDLKTYKTLNFEVLNSIETIQLLSEDDSDTRSLLKKPSSVQLLVENSMYQIISEEMINMFSSMHDFAFAITENSNKYEPYYQDLNILRAAFYSKILNTPSIEKYIEFYKWLDSSLGYLIDQLKPENSAKTNGLKVTIENHMLERSKYQHQLPMTIGPKNDFDADVSNFSGDDLHIAKISATEKPSAKDFNNTANLKSVAVIDLPNIQNIKDFNYQKTYDYFNTGGKQFNPRTGKAVNKTVMKTSFSSADGFADKNRDSSTSGEMSIYNSLLNKSAAEKKQLNVIQSAPTKTQTIGGVNATATYFNASTTSRVIKAEVDIKVGDRIYFFQDYVQGSSIYITAGLKTVLIVSYTGAVASIFFNDTVSLGSITQPSVNIPFSVNPTQDNTFIQHDIPYYDSNFASRNEITYDQINDTGDNLYKGNDATYTEPPVEWGAPSYHKIRVSGSSETNRIVAPFSVRQDFFANEELNTYFGVRLNNLEDTFFVKANKLALENNTFEIKYYELLNYIYPLKKYSGLKIIRQVTEYDEVTGTFNTVKLSWSSNSFNRNTAKIKTIWRDDFQNRLRDNNIAKGAFNCLDTRYNTGAGNGDIISLFRTTLTLYQLTEDGELVDKYIGVTVEDSEEKNNSVASMENGLSVGFTAGDVIDPGYVFHTNFYNTIYGDIASFGVPRYIRFFSNATPMSNPKAKLSIADKYFDGFQNYKLRNMDYCWDGTLIPFYDSYEAFISNIKHYYSQNFSNIKEYVFSNTSGLRTTENYTFYLSEYNTSTNTSYEFGLFNKFIDTKSNSIKFKVNAVKKLLPYNGFYPSQHILQVANIYKNIYIRSTDTEDDKQSIIQPFFAPGIFFNTIKAGVALSYPIFDKTKFTGSLFDSIYKKTSGEGVDNQGYHLIDDAFKKIPFEATLDPTSYLTDRLYVINSSMYHDFFHRTDTTRRIAGGSADPIVRNTENLNNYKLIVNNFYAECINFFLKNALSAVESLPEKSFQSAKNGVTYSMYLKFSKREDFSMFKTTDSADDNLRLFGSQNEPGLGIENYDLFTPSYFNNNYLKISWTADADGIPSLAKIHSSLATFAYNINNFMHSGDSVYLKQQSYNLNYEFDGLTGRPTTKIEDPNNKRWSIQTKFETPLIDYSSKEAEKKEDYIETVYSTNINTPPTNDITLYSEQILNGGIWTSKGVVPKFDDSITMFLEDVSGDASLIDLCGFSRNKANIGILKDSKKISEGVLMIPSLLNPTEQQKKLKEKYIFNSVDNLYTLSIPENKINKALGGIQDYKLLSISEIKILLQNSEKIDQTNSIVKLMLSMVNYNIPPHLNWLYNKNIKPFVMYVAEFNSDLTKQELADIWQGTMPNSSQVPELSQIEISHKLNDEELFVGHNMYQLGNQLQFKIFKVKYRAEINYYNFTNSREDDQYKIGNLDWYTFNWPYDYFSLIHLVNIQAGEAYNPEINNI